MTSKVTWIVLPRYNNKNYKSVHSVSDTGSLEAKIQVLTLTFHEPNLIQWIKYMIWNDSAILSA